MDNREIHSLIKKRFHITNANKHNLPFGMGRKYDRTVFVKLLAELNYNVGAEIGVRRGGFSRRLCRANPNLKIYCIDPWAPVGSRYTQEKQDRIFEEAKKNLAPYNAHFIRKTSMEAVDDFPDGSLDFACIDGNHHFDYVCLDIIHWSKKVKSGGIIACHDFFFGEVGVQMAVEAYVRSHFISPWYVIKELSPTAFWVKP